MDGNPLIARVPDLDFAVDEARAVTFAAMPQMAFQLRISQKSSDHLTQIQAVVLRCQIRINPLKRRYDARSESELQDLFGQPNRWSQTMRSMLWLHTSVMVPSFIDSVVVDMPVPCTFDFNVAATKYFHALTDGEIPLSLLFNGTIFYDAGEGRLQTAQIPWEKEADFRLPAQTWQSMMQHYYPNAAWLCVCNDVFDALVDFKRRHGLSTLDQALSQLLEYEAAVVP